MLSCRSESAVITSLSSSAMSPAGSKVEPVRLLLLQGIQMVSTKRAEVECLHEECQQTHLWSLLLVLDSSTLTDSFSDFCRENTVMPCHMRITEEVTVRRSQAAYLATRTGDLRKSGGGGRTGPDSQPHHPALAHCCHAAIYKGTTRLSSSQPARICIAFQQVALTPARGATGAML